jgi:hypothetical protein
MIKQIYKSMIGKVGDIYKNFTIRLEKRNINYRLRDWQAAINDYGSVPQIVSLGRCLEKIQLEKRLSHLESLLNKSGEEKNAN